MKGGIFMSRFRDQIQLIRESIFKGATSSEIKDRRSVYTAIGAYDQLIGNGKSELLMRYSDIFNVYWSFIVNPDNPNIQQITKFVTNIPKYLGVTTADENDIIIIWHPHNRNILDFFTNDAYKQYNNEQKKQELLADLTPAGDILFVSKPDGIISFSINDNSRQKHDYFIVFSRSSEMVKILKELAESPTTPGSDINR